MEHQHDRDVEEDMEHGHETAETVLSMSQVQSRFPLHILCTQTHNMLKCMTIASLQYQLVEAS